MGTLQILYKLVNLRGFKLYRNEPANYLIAEVDGYKWVVHSHMDLGGALEEAYLELAAYARAKEMIARGEVK